MLVPSSFSITRPLRRDDDDTRLGAFSFDRLRRQPVIVRANGFTVRGTLHGVDETDLYLRGELRWFVLPLTTITSVIKDPDVASDDDDDGEAADGRDAGDDDNDDGTRGR